jgi:hypothetical protein
MLPHATAILLVALYLGFTVVNAFPIQTTFLAIEKPIVFFLKFFKVSPRLLHLGGKVAFR